MSIKKFLSNFSPCFPLILYINYFLFYLIFSMVSFVIWFRFIVPTWKQVVQCIKENTQFFCVGLLFEKGFQVVCFYQEFMENRSIFIWFLCTYLSHFLDPNCKYATKLVFSVTYEIHTSMKSHTWNFFSANLYVTYSDPFGIWIFKKIHPLQSLCWLISLGKIPPLNFNKRMKEWIGFSFINTYN